MLVNMIKPRLHIQSVEARFGVIGSKLTSRYAESVQESKQNYAIVLDLMRMTIMPQPPLAHAKGYPQIFHYKITLLMHQHKRPHRNHYLPMHAQRYSQPFKGFLVGRAYIQLGPFWFIRARGTTWAHWPIWHCIAICGCPVAFVHNLPSQIESLGALSRHVWWQYRDLSQCAV